MKHLKPNPVASEIVDHCIECGFCESNCPSRDLTLTPRQRIASFKEIARLEGLDSRNSAEDTRSHPRKSSHSFAIQTRQKQLHCASASLGSSHPLITIPDVSY